jgi:tetratricopeptide (TPR) repeat protein
LAQIQSHQRRALDEARAQLEAQLRTTHKAQAAAAQQSRKAMEQARKELERVRQHELANVREHVERAMAEAREAQHEALEAARRATEERRAGARSRAMAPGVSGTPPAPLAASSDRERELEARVAELEARLAELEGRRTGARAGTDAHPRVEVRRLSPQGGQTGTWTFTAPNNLFGSVVVSGDDADCNPSRARVMGLGSLGGVAVYGHEDHERALEALEDAREECEDALEELDEEWESAFEEAEDELEEAEEELEEALDDRADEFEDAQLPKASSQAALPTDATVVWGDALRTLGFLPTQAVSADLLGALYGAAWPATVQAQPAVSVDLRDVVTQMRSEVEDLRATLRDLRREVEARRGDVR